MIEFLVAIVFLAVAVDVYVGLSRRTKGMQFQFSRYSMFNLKPGRYSVTLSKHYYNLPDNVDVDCRFDVGPDGHLDSIRACDNVVIGGSAAFGVGSPGNEWNISGQLRKKYQIDVINLAIPGWNIEQEVITLLRHLSVIKPRRIMLFDGANNLALALPFDYHGYRVSSDPLAFYGESKYERAVEMHFDNAPDLGQRTIMLAREVFRHSLFARIAYRMFGAQDARKRSPVVAGNVDFEELASQAVRNYLEWLRILVQVAVGRGIEVHCIVQPYYVYGRDRSEAHNFHFFEMNDVFDEYMVSAYCKLDVALASFEGATYHPLFKEMAKESVGKFTDAVHLNAAGYEVIADKISGIVLGPKNDQENC